MITGLHLLLFLPIKQYSEACCIIYCHQNCVFPASVSKSLCFYNLQGILNKRLVCYKEFFISIASQIALLPDPACRNSVSVHNIVGAVSAGICLCKGCSNNLTMMDNTLELCEYCKVSYQWSFPQGISTTSSNERTVSKLQIKRKFKSLWAKEKIVPVFEFYLQDWKWGRKQ